MLPKHVIRAMVKAEQMMDDNEIPFVWTPGPTGILERLAVTPEIMEDFGLRQGQSINTIIRNAILDQNLKNVISKLEKFSQDIEDSLLDPNFDYRNLENDNDS